MKLESGDYTFGTRIQYIHTSRLTLISETLLRRYFRFMTRTARQNRRSGWPLCIDDTGDDSEFMGEVGEILREFVDDPHPLD